MKQRSYCCVSIEKDVFILRISTFMITLCFLKHATLPWQRLEHRQISYSRS